MDLVMIGLEESMEVADVGERSRMIARNLANMPWISRVVGVCCPVSFPRRLFSGHGAGQKKLKDLYPCIYKKGAVSAYQVSSKFMLYSLQTVFPEGAPVLSRFDRSVIQKNLLRAFRSLKINTDILWLTNPRMVDFVQALKPKKIIFDCIDNLLELSDLKKSHSLIAKSYKWIDDHADLIYVANSAQKSMFLNNQKIHLLPNGVDDNFFFDQFDIPEDLIGVSGPRVGYAGLIQDRFDIDLTCRIVSLLPQYQFVFVGPIKIKDYKNRLTRLPNVRLLGSKPYSSMPAYVNSFNVMIIPHRVNELTNSMNPLKIYEGLAAGLPLVTTPVAFEVALKPLVWIANNAEAFAKNIVQAINEDSPEQSRQRRSIMRNHSWTARMKIIHDDILKLLSGGC